MLEVFPVVKVVATSWTHEMTGVILHFTNTDTWSYHWHPQKCSSLSDCIQPGWIIYPHWVRKKYNWLFHHLAVHSFLTKRTFAGLFTYVDTCNKFVCVLLHKQSHWNGKYLLDLLMQYFFLRQRLNCRVSSDLVISTKALFSQQLLLTCWPSAVDSLVRCLNFPHIAEPI